MGLILIEMEFRWRRHIFFLSSHLFPKADQVTQLTNINLWAGHRCMQYLFWAAADIHSTGSCKGLESIGLYHWKLITLSTTPLTTTWIHKWPRMFPSGWADSSSLIIHAYSTTSYRCFSCPGKNFKTFYIMALGNCMILFINDLFQYYWCILVVR